MRKVSTILTALFLAASLCAQTPQKMSYQAIIRNSSNELVKTSTIGMRISILKNSANGELVYTETQAPITNENGLVSIEIGGGEGFDVIVWSADTYYLKTETDPSGGNNYTITGTSQLLSVPYAFNAKTAERVSGHYIGEIYGGGIIYWLSIDGQHGLIASLDNLANESGIPWSNIISTAIGISSQSMTVGSSNTLAIISQSSHTNSAAKLCHDYAGGGYNDWYLPSNRELKLLTSLDFLIDYILDKDGNLSTNGFIQENIAPFLSRYWSSTELDLDRAYVYSFGDGGSTYVKKFYYCGVRAIRAF